VKILSIGLISLLLSISVFAGDIKEYYLGGAETHLGVLAKEKGFPSHETIRVVRTENSPQILNLNFFYKQTEMICLDRVPDNGDNHGNWECWDNHYSRYYYHRGYCRNYSDRNFLGICKKWGGMETGKTGRVRLVFNNPSEMLDGEETFLISITQKRVGSTSFIVSGKSEYSPFEYKIKRRGKTLIFDLK